MSLLSLTLFDHCSVPAENESLSSFEVNEPISIGIENNSALESSVNLDTDLTTCPIDISDTEIPDLDTINSGCEMTNLSDDLSSTSEHTSSDSGSGFMLIDDNFVTFDNEHPACSWGDNIDMSMNSEF
ncbi:hypothetical protein AT00_14150 [Pseudoalteromonas lipolytica SCSIO 04301]|uniref:hypothetical protein n=1 Tax=Pseudoalteromonas lipolytica TaxID=570156 RepID=UPI00044AC4AD|nr:hypothetical protein [Pseudoalteromonas lipolytica]EWH05765.1 hypothetical protein AT00_14150 [Pseudoalteromonas lipolytica SCSIO 04301]